MGDGCRRRSDRTFGAHLPGGDGEDGIPEDVADDDVEEAENGGQDTRGDDDSPEWKAEGLLGCGFLVEVSEDRDSDDDHGEAERNEARGWGEERPVTQEVGSENVELGGDEEERERGGDDVRNGIEEEELGNSQ